MSLLLKHLNANPLKLIVRILPSLDHLDPLKKHAQPSPRPRPAYKRVGVVVPALEGRTEIGQGLLERGELGFEGVFFALVDQGCGVARGGVHEDLGGL
jgi:hypothetical protein